MKKTVNFCYWAINSIFGIAVSWLCLLSLVYTCYMNSEEHTYFTFHNPIGGIIVIGIVCAFFVILCKKINVLEVYITKIYIVKWVILFVILLECLYMVISGNATPVSDQLEVLNAAQCLVKGDYSPFFKGGYVYMYSIQSGLIVVYSVFLRIMSETTFVLFFQVCSAIGVMFTYKLLYDIAETMHVCDCGRILIVASGILFVPYCIYAMFVYGTVLGFVFALAAIKYEIRFLQDKKIANVIFSALFILISLVIKSNYLIFFIGMLMTAIVSLLLDERNKRNIGIYSAYILLILGAYLFATKAPVSCIENISGQKLDSPMASVAWVEMGMQEGPRAEGWYNAYNYSSYVENDCNGELQGLKVKEDLKATIKDFFNHKSYAICFFTKKMASQWLNPSFESFWSIQQMGNVDKMGPMIRWMLRAVNINHMTNLFAYFEIAILFGTALFSILNSEYSLSRFICEIVFIGGFVFYMFWEAKGQYTIVYFVMLIPLAISGYLSLENKLSVERICSISPAVILVVASLVSINKPKISAISETKNDNDEFALYKAFFAEQDDANYSGKHIISPSLDNSLSLSNNDEDIYFETGDAYIDIIPIYGAYKLAFTDSNRYLSIYRNGDNGYNTEAASNSNLDGEYWKFENSGDGESVYIYNSTGYGLAYSVEGDYAYMTERTGSDDQKWIIR